MIIGFHITWTTYGHWFPNDPRGSWSDEVWSPALREIRALDEGRKVTRPRSVPRRELQQFLDRARSVLHWPVVHLSEGEINGAGRALGEVARTIQLDILACAILSNHVHLVVARHNDTYERIVNRLKGNSSQAVRELRGIPVATDRRDRVPIWTEGYWCRYINSIPQMERAIEYVQKNPVREGLGPQRWEFVVDARSGRPF